MLVDGSGKFFEFGDEHGQLGIALNLWTNVSWAGIGGHCPAYDFESIAESLS